MNCVRFAHDAKRVRMMSGVWTECTLEKAVTMTADQLQTETERRVRRGGCVRVAELAVTRLSARACRPSAEDRYRIHGVVKIGPTILCISDLRCEIRFPEHRSPSICTHGGMRITAEYAGVTATSRGVENYDEPFVVRLVSEDFQTTHKSPESASSKAVREPTAFVKVPMVRGSVTAGTQWSTACSAGRCLPRWWSR